MSQSIPSPLERLIWPVSLLRWRYTSQIAPWVSALFLVGIFVDYGGTIYIKYLFGALALVWVMTYRHTPAILKKCKSDLLVLIGIPWVLGMAHVMVSVFATDDNYLGRLFGALSAALLVILLPLFFQVGGARVVRQVRTGFRVVAVVIVIIASLNVLGILNVRETLDWLQRMEFGFVGIDPRQTADVDPLMSTVINLKIGHPLPLAFGMELASSWLWAGVVVLAVIVMLARGLVIGLILALFLALILFPRQRKRINHARTLKVAAALFVVTMVLTTVYASQVQQILTLGSHNIEELIVRFRMAQDLEDRGSLMRLGQIEGYLALIDENPWRLLVGAGPGFVLMNPMVGPEGLSEISSLNVALWFGVPYLLLFCIWLYYAAWQLWRLRRQPGYQLLDTGLIVGASVFWITGNFNPMMNSPLSIIAFMMLRTRILELSGYQPTTRNVGRSGSAPAPANLP